MRSLLALRSSYDPLVAIPPRRLVATVPRAKLVIVEGAGHGAPLTHAPEVTDHVLEFLARATG